MLATWLLNKMTRRGAGLLAALLIGGLWFGSAAGVQLDIGDGAGTIGDTVVVEVTTTDLTGLGVYSYELEVTWSSTRATLIDAPVTGTLTDPWGPATVNPQSGKVNVNAAGVSALSGSGTLINLHFVLGPSTGTMALVFSDFIFNEGSPADTLSNGLLIVSGLPTITISPNTGEILVGDSLQFITYGGTPPYTYTSSDPAVAAFAGTDYLKGVSPGYVFATSTDDNGITDDTNGPIYVRALKLSAGSGSGTPGDMVSIAMSITDPVPYDIRSAEFAVTYQDARLTAVGVDDNGTIAEAAGWQSSVFNVTPGRIDVSMAGAAALGGPGVLVKLLFLIDPVTYNTNQTLTVTDGIFNELYAPLHENGTVSITGTPVLTVNPDTYTIVQGDNLQFTVSGPATPPLTWGVTNPAAASIDGAGLMTGLASGVTRVFVVDNVGSTDTTGVITICDLYVSVPDADIFANIPNPIPVEPDRSLTGLGIYGYELTLTFDPDKLEVVSVEHAGTASAPWGAPVVNLSIPGQAIIVHAGSVPLQGTGPLIIVYMKRPAGGTGGPTTLTISKMLFNEGDPCALVQNGTIDVPTGITGAGPPGFHLDQNVPNPFNPSTEISYWLPGGAWATLRVYGPDGRLVRTLVDRMHDGTGRHTVRWDGTDDGGHGVASGVYFYKLETSGASQVRKMVFLK